MRANDIFFTWCKGCKRLMMVSFIYHGNKGPFICNDCKRGWKK